MPESVPLYPEMRVEEYLRYRAALKGVTRRDRTAFVNDAMDKSRIQDVRKKVIGQLSKGYRQRVGLADALVSRPEVLILDEPTIGLDPAQIRQARQTIADLAGQHTVILSTHILSEVEMICSHVAVISEGQIVAGGSLKELSKTHEREARIVVVVEAPQDALVSALAKVPGVARTELAAGGRLGAVTALVEAAGGSDPRGDIVRCIAAKGWNLLELRTQGLTLEEIFVKVVGGRVA
jgi:ABC-2 type transport system ATP-binding protein